MSDLKSETRGKLVRIAPDVFADFPDEQSVNDALRLLQCLGRDVAKLLGRSVAGKSVKPNARLSGQFVDPLADFDWEALYKRYDEKCIGYKALSPYLQTFRDKRPASDRELYYRLVEAYQPTRLAAQPEPAYLLMAVLYWKLYSQHTSEFRFKTWIEEGGFTRAAAELPRLFAALPKKLERNEDDVIAVFEGLSEYKLPGMKSKETIPVRSTLLHFIYPSTVPVFDRMVLQAVGVRQKDANKKYPILRSYLSFAWDVAEKHRHRMSTNRPESPLRLLDMALWVHRGEPNGP